MKEKSYHLISWRTKVAGTGLILMGIIMTFMFFDVNSTFWENFQSMILSFKSLNSFLGTLFMLLLKAVFIVPGIYFIKLRDEIIRAKIDDKGFYYKEMNEGFYTKGAFDLNPLTLLPFSKINNIYLVKSVCLGNTLEIEVDNNRIKLVTTNALSDIDKKEIYSILKEQIT